MSRKMVWLWVRIAAGVLVIAFSLISAFYGIGAGLQMLWYLLLAAYFLLVFGLLGFFVWGISLLLGGQGTLFIVSAFAVPALLFMLAFWLFHVSGWGAGSGSRAASFFAFSL